MMGEDFLHLSPFQLPLNEYIHDFSPSKRNHHGLSPDKLFLGLSPDKLILGGLSPHKFVLGGLSPNKENEDFFKSILPVCGRNLFADSDSQPNRGIGTFQDASDWTSPKGVCTFFFLFYTYSQILVFCF
jgi:hypothetical protein